MYLSPTSAFGMVIAPNTIGDKSVDIIIPNKIILDTIWLMLWL